MFRAVTILAAVTVFSGCSFRQYKNAIEAQGAPAERQRAGLVPSYAEIREKVLEPRCLQCHAQRAPLLTSYSGVKSALEGIRKAALTDQAMPPSGPLPVLQADLLRSWIDAGAPEFADAGQAGTSPDAEAAPPIPTPALNALVTWKRLKAEVLETSCLGCHYAGNHENLSDLSNAAALKENIGTTTYLTLVTREMPPEKSPALTPTQRRVFADWVADGMDMGE